MHGSISDSFYRDTWVEIDLDAIQQNVRNMKKYIPEKVQIMAVVKSNGYGHGATQVAEAAIEAGATILGVAILDEALAIRNAGIKSPILVLGYIRPEDIRLAIENDLYVTIFQDDWLKKAAVYIKENEKVFCHIKIDTGMGRLGISSKEEGNALIDTLKNNPSFVVEGIFTHFATADELDTTYYEMQQQLFTEYLTWFEDLLGKEIPIKHCSNSAAALRNSNDCYNLIRFGIAMYGLSPSEDMKTILPFPLKQAFSLHSKITHMKKMPKGTSISYGATYKTSDKEWIGTVPVGYADGWIRANSGGEVLVNGKRVPIVGRICMDQMMISLPKEATVGTQVTLIGEQNETMIPVDEVARRLDTINYEVTCTISFRVPRVFVKNGKVIQVENRVL